MFPCGSSLRNGVILELWRGAQLVKRQRERRFPYFLFGNVGANILDGRIPGGAYGIRAIVDGTVGPFTNFTMGGGSCR